jgi:hypothetical protein
VTPLLSFFSASEDDLEVIEEAWFDPSEALETVRAYLAAVESGSVVGVAEGVEDDLSDLESILVDAEHSETRFHLAIDY